MSIISSEIQNYHEYRDVLHIVLKQSSKLFENRNYIIELLHINH